MTATIVQLPTNGETRVATETPSAQANSPSRFKRVSLVAGTLPESEGQYGTADPTPIERIYPHLFDQNQQAGHALTHLRSATTYAQAAIDAFGEPDLDAVGGSLAQLATALSTAYPLTEFNPSLGGLVAFIRRAVLAAPVTEISRSGLNALQFVLRGASDSPLLDLEDAAEAIDRLEREGWRGENAVADKIVSILLGDSDVDANEGVQTRLFADLASPSP